MEEERGSDSAAENSFGNPLVKRPTWLDGYAGSSSRKDGRIGEPTPLDLAKPRLITIMRCVLAANTQVEKSASIWHHNTNDVIINIGLRCEHDVLHLLFIHTKYEQYVQRA